MILFRSSSSLEKDEHCLLTQYPRRCCVFPYGIPCSGEQGMAQWWERSPPTNVARVQIPPSTPYVGWVCLLLVLSFAPRGFPPGTPVFPSPQKPVFSNSNSTRNQVDEEPLCGCATSKSLFIYLFMFLFFCLKLTRLLVFGSLNFG